jgi:hypothetical protein
MEAHRQALGFDIQPLASSQSYQEKKSCLIDKFFFYDLIMYTMLGPCDCFFGRLDGFLSLTDTLEELGLVFVEPENENVVRLSHLFCDLFARGYDRWA